MKVYLAARYTRKDEMREYADRLQRANHHVTSRWVEVKHNVEDIDRERERASRYASEDSEDLTAADAVVVFTEPPRKELTRGGRHVEFGMALALQKRLFVVGPPENVFYALPQVEVYSTWDQLFDSRFAAAAQETAE